MSEPDRLEREMARLSADCEPPEHWQSRVFAAIADERIARELARIGEEHAPPVGWQARVLAATVDKPRRWWLWLTAPLPVLATALLLLWPPRPEQVALNIRTDQGGVLKRAPGTLVSAGEIAHLTVAASGPFRALWVYRDDDLEIACPGDDGCRSSDSGIEVAAPLRIGGYKVVALTSTRPIPPPSISYDRAVADARTAGIRVDERAFDAR